MKFKRDWPIIYFDLVFTIVFISSVLLIVFIPIYKAGHHEGLFLGALMTLSFYFVLVLCYYFMGVFTNYIVFDEAGIVFLQKKKTPVTLSWDSIIKISQTRYKGGKALVFEDIKGQKVWIYPTRRIENYLHLNHPELDHLYPDKKTFTRWTEIFPW